MMAAMASNVFRTRRAVTAPVLSSDQTGAVPDSALASASAPTSAADSTTLAAGPGVPTATLSQALGHPMADKRLEVLRGIQSTGSISQAARVVGVSYKAAWQALDTLTNLAGVALVERSVGGAGGGGTVLTAAGVELLAAAQTWLQARNVAVQVAQQPASPVAAVPPALAAGLGMRTSMRNQWPAQVQQVLLQGPLAQVQLCTADGQVPVQARLTAESAQLLALAVGQTVLVMAKATAVQVQPANTPALSAGSAAPDNTWPGVVTRVARSAVGDEVAVSLPGGVQIVGFAPAGSALRKGRKVQVHVPAFAVVVGV